MLRLLAFVAVLALATAAAAGPMSRWTSQPLEGAERLVAGGPGESTLVVLRSSMDPLRSFDGGQSWAPFTVQGIRPDDIGIAPTDARVWYATVGGVVYRTPDGGDTWEERSRVVNRFQLAPLIGTDTQALYLTKFDLPSCGFLCEGTYAHILTSTDGGRTWLDTNPQLQAMSLVASTADSRVAYAIAFVGNSGARVYRTVDHGATWGAMVMPDPPDGLAFVDMSFAAIALDQRDAAIAYVRPNHRYSAAAEDIYVTQDGGATWSRVRQAKGSLVTDPVQAGRVYLFALDGRTLESRDAGRTWATVDAQGASGLAHAVVTRDGRRYALDVGDAKLRQLDLNDGALALGSDLWWNPAESGTGLTITQHASNNPFVVWYAYDAAGAPVWRVVPGGTWHDRTFTGAMFETTGPAYFGGPFDPSRVSARAVGTAILRFDDENNAAFTYSISGGLQGEKRITRQLFAAPVPQSFLTTPGMGDLWWNASESGWGIAISHQYNSIFAAWYVYGDDGRPLWLVMPDAPVVAEFAGAVVRIQATGDLYITHGPPAGAPFDPAQVVSTRVGTATLHFRDQDATLEYTAFGRSERREITRQPF